jgi:protein-S-isoprenylcysteine O-methyltransferase Ste14
MYSQISLLIWWVSLIFIAFHLVYKKIFKKMGKFSGKPPKIPYWAIPLIITTIIGFIFICFLTISYIFNPNWAFSLFFPIEILNIEIIKLIGSILTILGTLIFIAAYFNLGSSTRLLLAEASETTQLKTKGLYSISRNPLYLGLHISMIGFCFIIPTWLMFFFTIIFMLNQDFRIKTEEIELEKRFGVKYIKYKKKVCRYLGRKRGSIEEVEA